MFTLNHKAIDLLDDKGAIRDNGRGVGLKGLGFVCKVLTKAEDLPERTIRIIASTEAQDRMGDKILAGGWELRNYDKNPVILWGHDHYSPPIARASKTWVEDKQLMQDWNFPKAVGEKYELSDTIYTLYQESMLSSASVGFAPLAWQTDFSDEEREELGLGEDGWLFTKQELMEVSAVSVPANQEALVQIRSLGIDTKPLEGMWSMGEVYEVRGDVDEHIEELTAELEADLSDSVRELEEDASEESPTDQSPITFTELTEADGAQEKGTEVDESGGDTITIGCITCCDTGLVDEAEVDSEGVYTRTVFTYPCLDCEKGQALEESQKQEERPCPAEYGRCTFQRSIEYMKTFLEDEGYTITKDDILTLDDMKAVLELEPEPAIIFELDVDSQVTDIMAVKDTLADAFQKKMKSKVGEIVKERINYSLGIVEE